MIGFVERNGPPRPDASPTSHRRSIPRRFSNEESPQTRYDLPIDTVSPRRRIVRFRPAYSNNVITSETTGAADTKAEPRTTLYRHAREQAWEEVSIDCKTHPEEATYINAEDGTTALHLAVMSRVGYSIESEQIHHPAPLTMIEELLRVHAEAATVKCHINTYTPLAYACLVSGPDCCLEETDELVRLFLKYCPESTSIYTAGGLSAVDVHIVSYSQAMSGRVDEGTNKLSGRTSSVVLRTLLENNPSLAKVRISNDKLGGPIEILYRCNSQAFMKLVAEYETKRKERARNRILTTVDTEDKNYAVLERISGWWVWRWTVLILKYETLPKKMKGARFFALQAASGLVGCPLPILTLAMAAFPNQIKEKDEMHGNDGNLPLHEVCSWPCEQDVASADPVISSRKGMAISALLQRYPNAVYVTNNNRETPLDLAIATGTTWDGGVRKLVRAYPASTSIRNSTTGLFPFQTAATVARSTVNNNLPLPSSKRSLMTHLKNLAKRDLQTVRTIYGLLRADPDVMIAEDDDDESDEQSSGSNNEELSGDESSEITFDGPSGDEGSINALEVDEDSVGYQQSSGDIEGWETFGDSV